MQKGQNLTFLERKVLSILETQKFVTLSALMNRLAISQMTAERVLYGLKAKGLITSKNKFGWRRK